MAKSLLRRIFFLPLPFCTTFSTLASTGVIIILLHHTLLTFGSVIPVFSEPAVANAKKEIQELAINSAQLNGNGNGGSGGQQGYGDGWIDLSYSGDNRETKDDKDGHDNENDDHNNENDNKGPVSIWDEEMKQATTVEEIENTMPTKFPTTFTVLGIIFIIVVVIIGICAVVVLIISD